MRPIKHHLVASIYFLSSSEIIIRKIMNSVRKAQTQVHVATGHRWRPTEKHNEAEKKWENVVWAIATMRGPQADLIEPI